LHSLARLVFAFVLAAFAASGALAGERTRVRVVIDPTSDGAIAHFTFAHPVQTFALAYESDEIRNLTWKITTPGVTRNGSLVTAQDGTAFDAFDVDVQTWNESTDATYPCLFHVGEKGLAFYAGYFIGTQAEFETTIEVTPAVDRIVEGFPLGGNVWRVDTVLHGNAGHRYVYIGARGDVVESRVARLVLPPGPAPAMIERIRANVDGMLGFYRRKFARPLQTKPLILMAANPKAQGSVFQGDVTNGPAVALRIFGDRWQTFDSKSDITDHFIAHEGAHFWNSGTSRAAKGSPAWLWEGSAELMALEARVAVTGRLTADGRRDHIEHALNDCVSRLLARALTANRSSATYVCGETLFWLADAAEKTRSRGRSDVFAIWRRILDRAESNGGAYTVNDVLGFAAPSAETKKAFGLFLADQGYDRWHDLPDLVKPLGIELQAGPPTDATLRAAMIFHILDLHCTGTRGMWHEDKYLKLDTGDRCGPLSGDPEVDALNGHNLYTDLQAAHAATTAACAQNADITLTRTGKPHKVTAPCTKPLPPLPPNFRILATP